MGRVDLKLLAQFLLKAKVNTYASVDSEQREFKLQDGSAKFIFEEPPFRYRDRFYGSNPFVGQEIVWHRGDVVWAMNYTGGVFKSVVHLCPPEKVYEFLKCALRNPDQNLPLRGPSMFKLSQKLDECEFTYFNEVAGNISAFTGKEKIVWTRNGSRPVYMMVYNGLLMNEGGVVD